MKLHQVIEENKGEQLIYLLIESIKSFFEEFPAFAVVPEPHPLAPPITQPLQSDVLFCADEKKELIQQFLEQGFVVVPVFSPEEVEEMRNKFHESLGIDHDLVLQGDQEMLKKLGPPRAKSKSSCLMYNKWKIDAFSDSRILDFVNDLMEATFFSG